MGRLLLANKFGAAQLTCTFIIARTRQPRTHTHTKHIHTLQARRSDVVRYGTRGPPSPQCVLDLMVGYRFTLLALSSSRALTSPEHTHTHTHKARYIYTLQAPQPRMPTAKETPGLRIGRCGISSSYSLTVVLGGSTDISANEQVPFPNFAP